jgi:hypothetical protein
MSKKTRPGRLKRSSSIAGEPTPPFLSEKLVAELQGAVNSARRKRMPRSHDQAENRRGAKSVSSGALAADPLQN